MKAVVEKSPITTMTTHYIDGAFVASHGQEVMDIVRHETLESFTKAANNGN